MDHHALASGGAGREPGAEAPVHRGLPRGHPVPGPGGRRGSVYDRNPASPTPYAYAEGLLSQADEDSRIRPLSTEDGYDRVLDAEVQLCGLTFGLVPGHNPEWARPFKSRYPGGHLEDLPGRPGPGP